jgi:type VI secretion system secreted protein Hcp
MAIYMKFEKPASGVMPEGEATPTGHEKWLELFSFQHGLARPIDAAGSGRKRSLGVTNFSDITLTCQTSRASNPIAMAVANGTVFPKVTIDFVRAGGDAARSEETYMTVTMENVLISSYSVSGSSDGVPMESFSLNYTKIEIKYLEEDIKTGKLSVANTFVYDTQKGDVG